MCRAGLRKDWGHTLRGLILIFWITHDYSIKSKLEKSPPKIKEGIFWRRKKREAMSVHLIEMSMILYLDNVRASLATIFFFFWLLILIGNTHKIPILPILFSHSLGSTVSIDKHQSPTCCQLSLKIENQVCTIFHQELQRCMLGIRD